MERIEFSADITKLEKLGQNFQ